MSKGIAKLFFECAEKIYKPIKMPINAFTKKSKVAGDVEYEWEIKK